MRLSVFLVGLSLLTIGCQLFLAKETRYLKSAQDRATQTEIRGFLASPDLVASTQRGESVWVYEIRQVEEASNNSWTGTGSWCDEYVLMFDRGGVLRRWTHKSQLHRGVLWPTYCVNDGFEQSL